MSPDWRSVQPKCRIPVDVDQKIGGLALPLKTGIPEQPGGVLKWFLEGGGGVIIEVSGLSPFWA